MRSTCYQFARRNVGGGPTKVLSVCLLGGLAALTACASEPDNDPASTVASAASVQSSAVQSAAVPSVASANGGGTASASNVLGAPSQPTSALESATPPVLSSAPMASNGSVPSSPVTAGSTPVGATSSGANVPPPMASSESDAGAVDPDPMEDPEPGRLKGITAQHNVYRAQVTMGEPLPDLVWDPAIAEIAQDWADTLAEDCSFMHSMYPGLGENLATFGASNAGGGNDTGPDAVDLWYSEIDCYSYGTIPGGRSEDPEECTAECDAYGGCGHYTQLVWRETLRVGCGVASCQKDGLNWNTYVCNYDPPGNYIGEYPY